MGGEVEGGKKGLELMHVWVLMCFSEDPLFHSFHYLLRLSIIQRKARNIVLKIFISIKEYIYIYIFQKLPVNIPRHTTYCLHQK